MNAPLNITQVLLAEPKYNSRTRWLASFVLVVMIHGLLAFALSYQYRKPSTDLGEGAAMVVELAEFVTLPDAGVAEAPQPHGEYEPQPEPDLPKPQQTPEPALPEALADPVEPEPQSEAVAMPEPEMREQTAPASRQAMPAQAPDSGRERAARIASQRASWQGWVNAHLEKHKRYPYSARSRREQGVAILRFKIDRQGRVLDAKLDQSSGYFLLDREVQGVIRRAQPLPEPPDEVEGDFLEVVWQVEFSLHSPAL